MNEMKKFTAFVVDDSPAALETLAADLREQPEFAHVETYTSYAEAALPLLELQPDVIFLDVEMPGRTGIEFLDSIRPKVNFSFRVVFYTAFSHYMLDAIRRQAFDFLLKPYKKSELRAMIDRLTAEDAKTVGRRLDVDTPSRKTAIQTISELLLITREEILMFNYQSSSRTWVLTLTDRSTHMLRKGTSADDLTALHPSLIRINNTCIINISYLTAVENYTQRCRLCPPFDDLELSVSRRYFKKLKEQLELL